MKESQHGDIVLMRRVHEDGIAYYQIPCIANAFLGGYSVVEFCEYGVRMGGRCRASMSVSATEQHSAFAIGKLCVEISGWIQRERVGFLWCAVFFVQQKRSDLRRVALIPTIVNWTVNYCRLNGCCIAISLLQGR